jgi:TolB-like protein
MKSTYSVAAIAVCMDLTGSVFAVDAIDATVAAAEAAVHSDGLPIEPWISKTVSESVRGKLEIAFQLAVAKVREVPECNGLFDRLDADGVETLRTTLYYPSNPALDGKLHRASGFTLAAALLLVFAAAAVWRARQAPPPETTPSESKRIVVLPFKNLGPPEDEYFADGMTSELISRLGVVSELEVISNTSSMYYKHTNRLIGDIGRELDVDFALEGEVRWERPENGPERVRITPQLIRVADDSHLWSELYGLPVEGFFEVQSDIAMRVIEQLEVALRATEVQSLEAIPTENIDAYNAYLRGLDHLDNPVASKKWPSRCSIARWS